MDALAAWIFIGALTGAFWLMDRIRGTSQRSGGSRVDSSDRGRPDDYGGDDDGGDGGD